MEFFDYENNDDILRTARNIYQNQLNKEVSAIEDAYYKPNGISDKSYGKQIQNAYIKHLKRIMPTIRNSNLGSFEQLSYLKNNSPKAFNMVNTIAQGLGTTPDKIMSYYNNEEFMKAFGPNKVRFIREGLKGLGNKSLGIIGPMNDMLMLQGAPHLNKEEVLKYLQKNKPELLEGYNPNTNTWRN